MACQLKRPKRRTQGKQKKPVTSQIRACMQIMSRTSNIFSRFVIGILGTICIY